MSRNRPRTERRAAHARSLAFVLGLLSVRALAAPPPRGPALDGLAFLGGSWATLPGSSRVEEQWLCPAGGTMIGMGRTTDAAGAKTLSFEFLRIEARADGIFYVAQPGGGSATEFRLVRLEEGRAVFENAAHDFPKRITYVAGADGGLTARVEGEPGTDVPAEEFRYRPSSAGCRPQAK
jgi:hypothetical protein